MTANSHNRTRKNRSDQKQYRPNSNHNKRRAATPKPKPLTWWQKLLKAIGLYKEPIRPQRPTSSTAQKGATKKTPTQKRETQKTPPQKVESSRLYVGNLSYEVTESELVDLFKGFGNVKSAEVVYNKRTQRSKGFAFVEMTSTNDAKRASEILHEQPFMGRNMIVNGARASDTTPQETSNSAA